MSIEAKNLPPATHEALTAIHDVLMLPRDRLGRLECTTDAHHVVRKRLTGIAMRLPQIPHGGVDQVDKAAMVLACVLGREPKSVMGR